MPEGKAGAERGELGTEPAVEEGASVEVTGDPDVAGGVDAEGRGVVHAAAGEVDEEGPVDGDCGKDRREGGAGGGLGEERGHVIAGIANDVEGGV